MARDRERAKRRRAERRGQGAPDPLEHSSADVDEARLAEAGATPPDIGDDDDLGAEIYADELEDDRPGRADDAVEGDAVSRHEIERGPRRRSAAASSPSWATASTSCVASSGPTAARSARRRPSCSASS